MEETRREFSAFIRTSFDSGDVNHDGFVDSDESRASMQRDYVDLDADGNGALTVDDVSQSRNPKEPAGTPIVEFDLSFDDDHDGELSSDEYVRTTIEQFRPMDTDGDGRFSWSEAEAYYHLAGAPFHPVASEQGSTTTRSGLFPVAAIAAVLLLGKSLSNRRRLTAVAVIVVAAAGGYAAPAGASAMYNHSDHAFSVQFACGLTCGKYWKTVSPNQSVSYPAKAGYYFCDGEATVSVTDHGWSTLTGVEASTDPDTWHDYDNGGNPIAQRYIPPPPPIHCSVSPY